MFNKSIFVVFIALSACGVSKHKEADTEKPVSVTLSTVSSGIHPAILASGEVEAAQTANISTRVMGRITNIFVKTGDRVSKGQLLATVWDDDIKAKRAQADAIIAEAQSAYTAAAKDYERFNNLYNQQSATAKELDNVTLQYQSAKARVAAANRMRSEINANLSYSNLTAPFSGIVTQKLSETGSIANPGVPILTIEQDRMLQVSAAVAESDISNIKLGDAATIQVKSTGKNFEGKITQINPSSRFTGGQYIVKISIPETVSKDIYTGMFASVSIAVKNYHPANSDVPLVPLSAIVNRDELTGIYTVSTNYTAMLRWIRLGKTYGDKVEVISGLSKDEQFIFSAESKLYNGAPVTVKDITGTTIAAATNNKKDYERRVIGEYLESVY